LIDRRRHAEQNNDAVLSRGVRDRDFLFDHVPQHTLRLAVERITVPVATNNAIRREMTAELANRVIIRDHTSNGRIAAALADVAGEIAPPAPS
jgi:hypothetical protein